MSKSLRFCFKVDKQLKVAVDENGNGAEAFVCVKARNVKSYQVPSKQYKNIQESFKKMLANQMGCDIEMLTPVTINEYLDNTEEDCDND